MGSEMCIRDSYSGVGRAERLGLCKDIHALFRGHVACFCEQLVQCRAWGDTVRCFRISNSVQEADRATCISNLSASTHSLLEPKKAVRRAARRIVRTVALFHVVSKRKEEQQRKHRLGDHSKKVIIEAKHVVERLVRRVQAECAAPRRKELWVRLQRYPLRHFGTCKYTRYA